MTPLPTRKPYAALPLLWVVVMLVLTLTPAQEMPRTPEWELLSFDTAAHAGVFAVLAALSWFSLRRQGRWPVLARYAAAPVLLSCVLFGALIEVLQYVMNVGRHAEWSDLLGDSLGAALALLLVSGGWRWWHRSRLAAPLLVLLLLGSSLFFAHTGRAQGVELVRARRTIEALAAPNMHGRGYVQQGEHRAAAYLRGRLRQLGLQPLAPDFTQPFTLDVNTFPGKLKLEVSDKPLFQPGQPTLQPGRDYIAAPNSAATRATFAKPLQLDSLLFSNADTAQIWLRREVKFHTLLLTGKQQARLSTLPIALQQHLDSAFAWVTLVPKLTASLAATQAYQPRLEVLAARWHNGRLVHMRVDADLKRAYPTQNLAAIVRGSAQPDSFLVVSAHYDHLGMMGKNVYFPGANDNASGVALLLELAAYYACPENRPACSVVFLLFGAEEAGLVGSTYFVQHPLVPLSNIKFLVNLDLLGTGEEGATVVNGRLLPTAFQRLTALNDAHRYLPRLTARGAAANSDHYPFSQVGVPAFFLYTRGGSLAYHDINDRPAALSLAGFAGAYGLVRDFLNASGARP
ncbi:M28 family peptidase [Hymenobacter sp. HMF4947]|uniref:M28 family peptidase n=1 Tax=Hymenobacter ginkgonis TaxID=2682976 RepID=A0A7K1TLD3_9BACT|nr:VanZ family protein [Hymenobacter ginkgonis]MVN79166.1 M28 family peptidase [Hymenobacter ginkgonis]